MTDKETAKAIGEFILRQKSKIGAMAALMDEQLDPRWRKIVDAEAAETETVGRSAYGFSSLLQAIDSQDDCNSLLHNLHQYIANGIVEE